MAITIYKTIKEAISHSTGKNGIFSCYEAPDGEIIFFMNGIPKLTVAAPKKG
jgi:hypothetical protein